MSLMLGGLVPGLIWFAGARLILYSLSEGLYYNSCARKGVAGIAVRFRYKLKIGALAAALVTIFSIIDWIKDSHRDPDGGMDLIIKDAVSLGIPHSLLIYAPSIKDRLEAQT